MKKIVYLVFCCIIIAVVSLMYKANDDANNGQALNQQPLLHFEKYFDFKNDTNNYIKLNIELPMGNEVWNTAMRDSLLKYMYAYALWWEDAPADSIAQYDVTDSIGLNKLAQHISSSWHEHMEWRYRPERYEFTTINIHSAYNTKRYVTYYYEAYVYTGEGAHGFPTEFYLTYDKTNKRFVNAASDILPEKKNHAISCVVDEITEMQKKKYGGEGNKAYWDSIKQTDFPLQQMGVVPEGIVFSYPPYQLDCYAAGFYHVVVPLDKIRSCLTNKPQKPQ